jgi:hypothetical protein
MRGLADGKGGHWTKLRPTRTCIGAWLDRRWPWALYPRVQVAFRNGGTWHAGAAGCGVTSGGAGESRRGPGKVVTVAVAAQPGTAGGHLATHAAAAMGGSGTADGSRLREARQAHTGHRAK